MIHGGMRGPLRRGLPLDNRVDIDFKSLDEPSCLPSAFLQGDSVKRLPAPTHPGASPTRPAIRQANQQDLSPLLRRSPPHAPPHPGEDAQDARAFPTPEHLSG
jgi:hypothetical protein